MNKFLVLGFTFDVSNGLCYRVLPDLNDREAAEAACEHFNAELVQFENDQQVLGLLALMKAGKYDRTYSIIVLHNFIFNNKL